jgi:magnesium-transporting ATPase (P-type)
VANTRDTVNNTHALPGGVKRNQLDDFSGATPDVEDLSESQKKGILDIIDNYAHKSLRTIGMVYKYQC